MSCKRDVIQTSRAFAQPYVKLNTLMDDLLLIELIKLSLLPAFAYQATFNKSQGNVGCLSSNWHTLQEKHNANLAGITETSPCWNQTI